MSAYFFKKATFLQDHRCFKQGDIIEFRSGVNLLVGDQGTGKSTLLSLLQPNEVGKKQIIDRGVDEAFKVIWFDFEKGNPRTEGRFRDDMDFKKQLVIRFSSHGEVNKRILIALENDRDCLVLLDEPDTALSPRSCYWLALLMQETVVQRNVQIIASVHNPILIDSQPQVYSLEHRAWMAPCDFLSTQRVKETD